MEVLSRGVGFKVFWLLCGKWIVRREDWELGSCVNVRGEMIIGGWW